MKIFLKHSLLAVMFVTAAGCDVEGALNDLADDAKKAAIETAFAVIQETAEANGGTAAMVNGETTIEVTKADSPILGAKVVVPAGAIPAGIEYAAVAIEGGTLPDVQADDVKTAGPGAVVILRNLDTGEDITPAAKLKITLPFKADTKYPKAKLNLGIQGEGIFGALEGSKTDDGADTVTGESDKTGLFAAIWPVSYEGGPAAANTLVFTVFKDGKQLCAGYFEDAAAQLLAAGMDYMTTGSQYVFATGFQSNASTSRVSASFSTFTPPDPESLSLPYIVADPLGSVVCPDASEHSAVGAAENLSLLAWTTTTAAATATCAATDDCFVTVGTAHVTLEMDFTANSGAQVKIAFDVTIPDFQWYWDN
jgi:hypothetical protein